MKNNKLRSILPLSIIPFLIFIVGFKTIEWYQYKDADNVFRISIPSKPEITKKSLPTNSGKLDVTQIVYKASSESESNLRYLITSTIMPNEKNVLSEESNRKTALKSAINGSARNHKATIISSKDIVKDGYSGIEAEMSMQEGAIIICTKQFLIKDKHVGLMVYTLSDNKNNTDINKFFSSFIIEK